MWSFDLLFWLRCDRKSIWCKFWICCRYKVYLTVEKDLDRFAFKNIDKSYFKIIPSSLKISKTCQKKNRQKWAKSRKKHVGGYLEGQNYTVISHWYFGFFEKWHFLDYWYFQIKVINLVGNDVIMVEKYICNHMNVTNYI